MRARLSFLLVAICLGTSFLPIVQAGSPDKLNFDQLVFTKAFSDKSAAGPFSEYLPSGQSLKSWTKLMGYYEFPGLKNPSAAAAKLAEVVKAQNPDAQSQIIENARAGVALVDFVTWPADSAYVEFNIWKYRKNPAGGLIAIQYAERAYVDQEAFLKKLRARRDALIPAMAAAEF